MPEEVVPISEPVAPTSLAVLEQRLIKIEALLMDIIKLLQRDVGSGQLGH